MSFEEAFKAYSKFGDSKSDGKYITLSQSDKWMKQANIIDGKKITTTDTGIYFKKLKNNKVPIGDYLKFLEDLARDKKMNVDDLKSKMLSCNIPGLSGATTITASAAAKAATDRLTDTTKYTGAHKQRFDAEGRGRGVAGRSDATEDDGYVKGYKDKDTYDKRH